MAAVVRVTARDEEEQLRDPGRVGSSSKGRCGIRVSRMMEDQGGWAEGDM